MSEPSIHVILGIGNPGNEYHGTRHNIGWEVIDHLAALPGAAGWSRRWQAQVNELNHHGHKMLLVKPQTFVNCSGESAQAVLAFYKLPPSAMLVIVDDVHLALGDLRLRAQGSAGGHNGLKDIAARIGENFPRLRVGIGKPEHPGEQISFVLGRFRTEERADVVACVAKAAAAALAWVSDGPVVACRFNGPLHPPPPRPKLIPGPAPVQSSGPAPQAIPSSPPVDQTGTGESTLPPL